MFVQKRDNRVVPFDASKIEKAIVKAMKSPQGKYVDGLYGGIGGTVSPV